MNRLLFPIAMLAGMAAALPAHAAASAPVAADAACSTTIEGRPGKKFSLDDIDVPASCERFTVHLLHTGKKPREQAGHNWVLVAGAQLEGVIRDGLRAGAGADYLPPRDSRIIAATPMLGGGERASVSFPVARLQAGVPYTFFCSFPSHAMHMRGTLSLRPQP
ncbi:azurin [Herbaspirillum robiniae]|nr:azurin [Herbaspirillum robiniae]